MLGGLLALLSATTFAITNAAVRRGVLSGSAVQATTLSIPVGAPIFFCALLLTGDPGVLGHLPRGPLIAFSVTGITHFIIGRYANYRAIGAIGTNLAGPVMQFNLVVSLALAILFLGETLTVLRIVGILLIFAGPAAVSGEGARAQRPQTSSTFTPRMAEGYVFAAIAAVCYGLSPVLLRYAGGGRGLDVALGGGVVSASVATVIVTLSLALPGHWREIRGVTPKAAKWFLFSAVMVYVSQVFYYMAISLAPVTIIAPISAFGTIIRLHVSHWVNPQHEMFGPRILIATGVSFVGVVVLTASVDGLPLPPAWAAVFAWHWP